MIYNVFFSPYEHNSYVRQLTVTMDCTHLYSFITDLKIVYMVNKCEM